eukprot:m.687862 g.687862  ORF g.687862 m.687862 type:complete len:435 (+) comp58629_c0_seq38:2241-3545(+)
MSLNPSQLHPRFWSGAIFASSTSRSPTRRPGICFVCVANSFSIIWLLLLPLALHDRPVPADITATAPITLSTSATTGPSSQTISTSASSALISSPPATTTSSTAALTTGSASSTVSASAATTVGSVQTTAAGTLPTSTSSTTGGRPTSVATPSTLLPITSTRGSTSLQSSASSVSTLPPSRTTTTTPATRSTSLPGASTTDGRTVGVPPKSSSSSGSNNAVIAAAVCGVVLGLLLLLGLVILARKRRNDPAKSSEIQKLSQASSTTAVHELNTELQNLHRSSTTDKIGAQTMAPNDRSPSAWNPAEYAVPVKDTQQSTTWDPVQYAVAPPADRAPALNPGPADWDSAQYAMSPTPAQPKQAWSDYDVPHAHSATHASGEYFVPQAANTLSESNKAPIDSSNEDYDLPHAPRPQYGWPLVTPAPQQSLVDSETEL